MKRFLVLLAVLIAFTVSSLFAVGTTVVTKTRAGSTYKIRVAWTSTAGGAVSGNTITVTGEVLGFRFVPGTGGTVPTDLYDVTLLDSAGADVMKGVGANLSATIPAYVSGANVPVIISGTTVDPVVANAGASKTGIIEFWVRPPQ